MKAVYEYFNEHLLYVKKFIEENFTKERVEFEFKNKNSK